MPDIDPTLVTRLLDNYIYQKAKLLEDAGHHGKLDERRLRSLMLPRIEKMASVVHDWDVQPDILMEAIFDWAKFNKHPDGPMPNMLFSSKYLTKALSNYLQVPYEVVVDKRSAKLFLERRDFEFTRMRQELERAGVTDVTTATSYPVEVRYLIAVHRMDMESMFYMAQELLAMMSADRRVTKWLAHRGVLYERVAAQFNKRKNQPK
jgi:hypothetical protein